MKVFLGIILAAGLSAGVACFFASKRAALHQAQLAEQQAAWQNERVALEQALAEATSAPRQLIPTAGPSTSTVSVVQARMTPHQIVAGLRALKIGPGAPPRAVRQAIYWLQDLITAGPSALPAIGEFLARNEDSEFDFSALPKGRGGVPNNFIIPPSLRFGLLDVVRQIGGVEGERLLAETMSRTDRGMEVAWLARTLQEIAPNSYRDAALAAARDLLARPAGNMGALDRPDRDQLFSVLLMYGDTSYASTAQTQLLRPDGQLDRSTLDYLQRSLGAQSVAVAAQLYNDPRVTGSASKEPLARLALNFVGTDAQANEFYYKANNDMMLTPSQRKNLIEDLNEDGFPDRKNLTARDLPLIENRLSLIDQVAPAATDPANIAAFKEAYKDLLNMRERVLRPPPAPAK
jgi:hypothetical protein